jgi:hypothetical protein
MGMWATNSSIRSAFGITPSLRDDQLGGVPFRGLKRPG